MKDEINAYWEKRKFYEENIDKLNKIIDEGNQRAREFAQKTMEEVREIIGL